MPLTNPQVSMLTMLLDKFTKVVYIDNNELELMHNYIFSLQPCRDFDDSSELYQAVNDLKFLAEDNQFTSLQEMSNYFDSEQKELVALVEPLLNDVNLPDSALSLIFNASLRTASVKLLTIHGVIPCSDVFDYLYNNVKINDWYISHEKEYKEINMLTHCLRKLPSMVYGSFNHQTRILPNTDHYYYKNYFESFSLPSKKYSRLIYLFKYLRSCKKFFSIRSIKNRKADLVSYQKREKNYEMIFKNIKAEQPIQDVNFKTSLSRLMLTSKLNNPIFKERVKSNQSSKSSITAKLYYKNLLDKRWSILKSPAGQSWITSDNPGISIDVISLLSGNGNIQPDPFWTSIDDRSMIYFPLSRDYCLKIEPLSIKPVDSENTSNFPVIFEQSSAEEVKVVNSLIFSSKPDILISETKGIQFHEKEIC